MTGERKGRSALKFHALTRGGLDATPLHTVNRPGLAIDLSMDPATYTHMLIRGVRDLYKRRATNVAVSFGGLKPCPAVLRLRGASSLKRGDRVNFAIDLLKPVMITPEIEIDRFYLVNMVSDPDEFKLEFAYRLLGELGLFPCIHQYVKVLVNGEAQGMFLLVERPRNAIRRAHPGTVSVFRRGRPDIFRAQWSRPVPFVRRNIDELTRLGREGSGEVMVALNQVIDLEAYLTWTATNSIVRNADTLDELFLYEVRANRNEPEPLRIMAWDYDEILQDQQTSKILSDPLLLTRRTSPLDVLIKNDTRLYERYRATLGRLLANELAIELLVESLREVHVLRDSLDDGLPPATQEARRSRRRIAVEEFERDLRARHAELLRAVSSR